MIGDANRKLRAEILRLETLYFFSVALYSREAKAHYRRSSTEPIIVEFGKWQRELARNVGHFRSIVTKQLPRILRETILVRLVSAFEVFLIDLIREIYLSRSDLLRRDGTVELPYSYIASLHNVSELLSKLVERDCRTLTNAGLRECERYFAARFNLRFDNIEGYKHLQELHDRRHLLVHRLGKTDQEYRHRYNYDLKKTPVDEKYLIEAFELVRRFSESLTGLAIVLAEKRTDAEPQDERTSILTLELVLRSKGALETTNPSFRFLANEKLYILSDLTLSRAIHENGLTLTLKGGND